MVAQADLLTLARAAVKSDGDDDDILEQYFNSAIKAAEGYCRRRLYFDADTMANDKATFPALIDAAESAWETAQETYDSGSLSLLAAWRSYITDSTAAMEIMDGILIDDVIAAAILLITGHFYKNRQEVVAGAAAAAMQIPMGAQAILQPKMAV